MSQRMDPHLGIRIPRKRSGTDPFLRAGVNGLTLADFWSWCMSDLLVNTNRGLLAEFLVARAIDDPQPLREPWRAYDVRTPEGITVEVKSASYLQSWAQKSHTSISFGIAPTRAWDPRTGEWEKEQERQADVYVFALLATKEQRSVDPADVAQWKFLVVGTEVLNDEVGYAKSISLGPLRRLGAVETTFDGLADAVRGAAATGHQP